MVTTRFYKKLLLLGSFLFLLLGTSAFTQEKGKEVPKEEAKEEAKEEIKNQPKYPSLIRAGFTRPGNPTDKVGKDGQIIQAALDMDRTGPMIGSTVYFAVFKGTGAEDEVFGTQFAGLVDGFVAGHSFDNSVSPHLDRKARYLYLYQIVNDRGLNPPKDGILPAVDGDINTAHISSFALRLLVDPRYITSWGHFQNISFESKVADRKVGKDGIIAAAEDTHILPMALSSNPAVEKLLPHKRFQERSPAYGLGDLLNNFGLDKSNLNLQNSSAYVNLLKKKGEGKQINWVANEMEAAVEGGREPDYVQLMYNNLKEDEEPTLEGRFIGDTIFRVDFKKTNTLKIGQHSVVFGFTSDLPPQDEPIRVEGPMPQFTGGKEMKAPEGKEIKEAGLAPAVQGVGQGLGSALGTAPTPVGGGGVSGAAMTSGLIGGGTIGGGGGVGGFAPPLGVGGIGTAGVPFVGSGVPGSNQGQGTQSQAQAQQQTPATNTNTINFNATLTNQQSQQQAQIQAQLQAQSQSQNQNNNNNHHHHHGHVVPEPSAIILGLLGMPALYFFRRRRGTEGQMTS